MLAYSDNRKLLLCRLIICMHLSSPVHATFLGHPMPLDWITLATDNFGEEWNMKLLVTHFSPVSRCFLFPTHDTSLRTQTNDCASGCAVCMCVCGDWLHKQLERIQNTSLFSMQTHACTCALVSCVCVIVCSTQRLISTAPEASGRNFSVFTKVYRFFCM